MENNMNALQVREVECPYCKRRAKIVARRGKGQFRTKYAVIGAICTTSLLWVGALAGFLDYVLNKKYIVCEHCGFDGFEKADFRGMQNIRKMEFTGSVLEDFGLPIRRIAERIRNEAAVAGVPLNIRLEQAYDPKDNDLNVTPCLILENPRHMSDYYRFCLVYRPDPVGCLSGYGVFGFGRSPQMEIAARQEANLQSDGSGFSAAAVGALAGRPSVVMGGLAYEAGGYVHRSVQKASDDSRFSRMAWEEETAWYAAVRHIVCGILGTESDL